jgi:dipeptidyl aminopeptidase/acylaminoacyl peptidase
LTPSILANRAFFWVMKQIHYYKIENFPAAVSGAAISDMVSWYFSNSKSQYPRIMAKWIATMENRKIYFFEDKELYLKNSPYADNVTTLLSWVGKMELIPTNRVYFFNALRRQEKRMFYWYIQETAWRVSRRIKWTLQRITDWFDRYLKGIK